MPNGLTQSHEIWYDKTRVARTCFYRVRTPPSQGGGASPKSLGPTYSETVWPTATKFGAETHAGE